MAKQNKYDRQHQRNINRYLQQIDKIYREAASEAAKIGMSLADYNPDVPFSFADYPSTRKKIERLLQTVNSDLSAVIVNGIRSEWTLANNKNNELCHQVFGDNVGRLSSAQYRRYFNNNEEAREAFIIRKESDLRLSDRVWNYTTQFKEEIEMGLDLGIGQGLSADELSRELRDYLKHPDKLFRRVRDKHGQLHLSKAAAAFHPGRGVYRSSYKNARRLAATETNMAYRSADHERWQQLDFVVGILIEPSKTNHPVEDICDDLKGKYPKDFKFTGWHPHCRCHALSILKTLDEMAEDNKRILRGEDVTSGSVNEVTSTPKAFDKWIRDNEDRVLYGSSVPYFIRENPTYAISSFSIKNQPLAWEKITDVGKPMAKSNKKVADFTPFTMTEEKLQGFKDRGMIPDGVTLDLWEQSPLNGLDPDRLTDQMKVKAEEIGMSFDRIRIIAKKKNLESVIRADGDGFEFTRRFWIDSDGLKHVEHEYFTVDDQYQGKGFSKTVLRAFYQEYRAIGIADIEVHANINVGGYTWAKFGFQAKSRDDVVSAINWGQLTKAEDDYIGGLIDNWYKTRSYSEPFPMKKIADLTYGRKALLGRDWHGVINLRDDTQRKIFEEYLGI